MRCDGCFGSVMPCWLNVTGRLGLSRVVMRPAGWMSSAISVRPVPATDIGQPMSHNSIIETSVCLAVWVISNLTHHAPVGAA
jgi:hypothetical protein